MPRKGGFTSYIDPDGSGRVVVNGENMLMHGMPPFKYEEHLNLLDGESIVRKAQRVQRTFPFMDAAKGVQTGCLICTNFKVTFITAEENQDPQFSSLQKNKLISENDIPLSNVDSIYLVSKSGKRKPATAGAKISGKKKLEIRCKDFKVVTFSFALSDREDARQVSTAIVHHSFPTRLDLLFAFEYCKNNQPHDSGCVTKKYSQLSEWEEELQRLNVRGYKPVICTTAYSLPPVIVVPSTLNNNHIVEASQQFVGRRPPIWCYSHSNGSALIRMSLLFPETTKKEVLDKMLDAIAQAHPTKEKAAVYDLGKSLPSIKDIKSSFEKLKDLCCPINEQEVWDKDSSYMSSLDSTRWLQTVGDCLHVTNDVANTLSKRKPQSVIIQENDSRDLTAVISCLVQVALDPFCRTIHGFQNLIEREWVALGHKFADRCGLITRDNEESPLFLLFLDCVWQLTRQYPSAFQFSEIYLIRLLDSINMGLFDNFIFNGKGDRTKNLMYHMQTTNSGQTDVNLMSVWDWSTQFDEEAWSLSLNPLFWTDDEAKSFRGENSSLHNGAMEHQRVVNSFSNELRRRKVEKLQVREKPPFVKLWEGCYLRWIAPVEIVRGGQVMQYLSQYIVRQQVAYLQQQIDIVKKGSTPSCVAPPASDILGYFKADVSRHPLKDLTSSFPFISGTTPNPVWYSKSTFPFLLRSSLAESTEELDKT